MKLNSNVQEELLGSKAKVKVLAFLLLDGRPSSERELAARIGLSHMTGNKVMKEFESIGLVEAMRIGKSAVWALNKSGYAYDLMGPLGEFFNKKQPVFALRVRLGLRLKAIAGIKTAYLIGSVAEGTEKPTSDVDLLVISKSGKKEECLGKLENVSKEVMETFGNLLSPIIFEENDPDAEKWLRKAREKGEPIV